jgi:peptidoglycan/xylan/chitin deacetylase (PgdA/CDA1 family)
MFKIPKRKFRTAFNLMFNKPIGNIYMLHRVCAYEDGKLSLNENMKVSPEFLERFIVENIEKFEFLSIDQVTDVIIKKRKSLKPFIVFTFDDGYVDNYQYAFPIFQKYNIPFTIYISTGLIDGSSMLWWYLLEDIVMQNDSVVLNNGLSFCSESLADKESAFLQIRKVILELPTSDFDYRVRELLSIYTPDPGKYSTKLVLNWNQILEMSKSPLCTIAAHTVSHRRLTELSDKDLLKEMIECKRIIENKINKTVEHFSYPFGTSFEVNERVIDIVKKSGYKAATFANGGQIRKFDGNLFRLNRTMFVE